MSTMPTILPVFIAGSTPPAAREASVGAYMQHSSSIYPECRAPTKEDHGITELTYRIKAKSRNTGVALSQHSPELNNTDLWAL